MAVSKIDTWSYWHKLNDEFCLNIKYDMYADMSNANAQPYLRVNHLEFRTLRNMESWLKQRVACTVKLQINGSGTTYTFSSGSSLKHSETDIFDLDFNETIGYYYVEVSSTTNINIPKAGEEFTIVLAVTTKNGEEYTVTQYAAGPISETITGPTKVMTGQVAKYSLSRPVSNGNGFAVSGTLGSYAGYISPYTTVSSAIGEIDTIEYLPMSSGSLSVSVTVTYSIQSHFEPFADYYTYYGYNMFGLYGRSVNYRYRNVRVWWDSSSTLLLTSVTKTVTCTAGTSVDESLRPVFMSMSYDSYYARQLERYGGAVQGRVTYGISVTYRNGTALQYGSRFYKAAINDYTSGRLVASQYTGSSVQAARQSYSVPLNDAVNNAMVVLGAEDTLGFTTEYTDYVTVIPYHSPRFTTASARRCSLANGSVRGELYSYNGDTYQVDDYGEYVLIEWGVDFAPLNNANTRTLTITAPSRSSSSGYSAVTINLPDYICNGYFVAEADPERSYDVVFTLKDDFHGSDRSPGAWVDRSRGYYSDSVVYTQPVNTAFAMIDFKHGGTGVALGKVSELDNTFDIHRNWLLKMPYETLVQSYNTDGSSVRLYEWMKKCIERMDTITNKKPWGVYGERYGVGHTWFDGFTKALIPSGYGEIYEGGNYRCMSVVPNRDRFVGITHVEPFTVNRNYLNIRFDPSYSFRGQGHDQETYVPMIYLCSTRPTTINQTTGRPDATIVDYHQLTTAYSRVGGNDDGYSYWRCERGSSLNPSTGWTAFDTGILHSFDVSARKGQKLWFVVTCRQGGASQSGYYTYSGAQINLYDVVLSDSPANYDHY